MKIQTDSGEISVSPSNAVIMGYDNDMMDGMFVDLDDYYAFVSSRGDAYPDIAATAVEEGVKIVQFAGEVNWNEPPHCYVAKSIGKFVVDTAEELING